jgi:hypothetical protein
MRSLVPRSKRSEYLADFSLNHDDIRSAPANVVPANQPFRSLPALSSVMRENSFKKVDLPASLRPMRPSTSAGTTSKLSIAAPRRGDRPCERRSHGRRIPRARAVPVRRSRERCACVPCDRAGADTVALGEILDRDDRLRRRN